MSVKSTLSAAALALLATAVLTACQSGGASATTGAGAPAGGQPSATASAASDASGSAGTTSGSDAAPASVTSTHPAAGGGGHATSDSYAYTHPCAKQQLSLQVVRRASAPSQRVIEVRNTGTNSCGLSYYPLVSLDSAQGAPGSTIVKPLIPGGLGGAPAYPLYAGRTAYAVIDLDPSGASTGTVAGIDELNVLADGDHMPNADTVNFPLGSGAKVLGPKLGLYRSTVADAGASMAMATVQS